MAGEQRSTPREVVRVLGVVAATVLVIVVALFAVVYVSFTQGGPQPAPAPTSRCAEPPAPPSSHPTIATAPSDGVLGGSVRWTARLVTTCGSVTLVLDASAAPRSVSSFVVLARSGYWTDSVCHRLTSRTAPTGFLQCGDPSGDGTADPGYALPLENVPRDRTYRVGDVALARGAGVAGTAGEFLIVHRAFTLPPGETPYSLIGRVRDDGGIVAEIAGQGGEDTRPDGPPFRSISIRTVEVHPS